MNRGPMDGEGGFVHDGLVDDPFPLSLGEREQRSARLWMRFMVTMHIDRMSELSMKSM